MVLVNAMYLDARWASPFLKQRTTDQRFERLDGTRVKVPTMHQEGSFPVVAARDYVAVELPYRGDGPLEAGRHADTRHVRPVRAIPGPVRPERRHPPTRRTDHDPGPPQVRHPDPSRPGEDPRSDGHAGGVRSMLRADFSGMSSADPEDLRLYIANVFHQAFITVAEKGTVAARRHRRSWTRRHGWHGGEPSKPGSTIRSCGSSAIGRRARSCSWAV